ncbi:MAG: hypothetical protein JNL51_03935 [Chitinophagaceae bacterium]|nr:hypothetical protein [Chitinophagaceae bacterium]
MKLFASMTVLLLAASLLGCKKDDGVSSENAAKATEFKAFVDNKPFQIREYYSDKPIDYIDTDAEVKQETNLWKYVSPWIKDDFNVFNVSTGQVAIAQNEIKIEGNNEAVILKSCSVSAEKTGVYFNFLNYLYQPLKYRLEEFGSDYFIISADWTGGARVFTKFVVLD